MNAPRLGRTVVFVVGCGRVFCFCWRKVVSLGKAKGEAWSTRRNQYIFLCPLTLSGDSNLTETGLHRIKKPPTKRECLFFLTNHHYHHFMGVFYQKYGMINATLTPGWRQLCRQMPCIRTRFARHSDGTPQQTNQKMISWNL